MIPPSTWRQRIGPWFDTGSSPIGLSWPLLMLSAASWPIAAFTCPMTVFAVVWTCSNAVLASTRTSSMSSRVVSSGVSPSSNYIAVKAIRCEYPSCEKTRHVLVATTRQSAISRSDMPSASSARMSVSRLLSQSWSLTKTCTSG